MLFVFVGPAADQDFEFQLQGPGFKAALVNVPKLQTGWCNISCIYITTCVEVTQSSGLRTL